MNKRRNSTAPCPTWHFALTIFLGAFLLFQVQPMISKMILPWFGGSPSVWTTCMLFFQSLLVAGYAYAHGLVHLPNRRLQLGLHLALLLLACVVLPITPGQTWKPHDGSWPALRILSLLLVCVGLPYFVLSTTGPLVQWWFARSAPKSSPYRLFALSNAGSLIALLTYPFLIEPTFPLAQQGTIWSMAFVAYALTAGWLAWRTSHAGMAARPDSRSRRPKMEVAASQPNSSRVAFKRMTPFLVWVLLSAFGSVALLVTTDFISQDIAVVPFLWIAPLSLYLLSFIICFQNDRWYSRRWCGLLSALAILLVANSILAGFMEGFYRDAGVKLPVLQILDGLVAQVLIYLSAMFLLCMICHGELARRKPDPQHLTRYYLAIAIGGALGGVSVGIVCPLIFRQYFEFNAMWLLGYGLSVAVFATHAWNTWLAAKRVARAAVVLAGVVGLVVVAWAQYEHADPYAYAKERNFYGAINVRLDVRAQDESPQLLKTLRDGRIIHGSQYVNEDLRREPTTYYTRQSGVGILFDRYPRPTSGGVDVGLVGLGAGTLSAYGKPGDSFRFYEIDPKVVKLAHEHFTYLRDSAATVEIVDGDARLSLEDQATDSLDILILDAFSGDAIPTHLLTKEAFELYLDKVRVEGVICIHVSNKYLDLPAVVVRLAEHFKLHAFSITADYASDFDQQSSTWIWITKNDKLLDDPAVASAGNRLLLNDRSVPLWTDQHCSLLNILD